MEEKKEKKEATPLRSEKAAEQQKLTYEQLNDACNQLFQQNQQLIRRLKEVSMENIFKRLDYLFKVLNYADVIKDPEFINSCVDEIKEVMILPEEEKQKEDK